MSKVFFIVIAIFVFGTGIFFVSRNDYPQIPPSNEEKIIAPSPTSVTVPEPTLLDIPLTITKPNDGAVVRSSSLLVKGTTKSNAEVFVNEKETRADGKGTFSVLITLEEGENYIVVTVTDEDGNISEKDLTVAYEPEQ